MNETNQVGKQVFKHLSAGEYDSIKSEVFKTRSLRVILVVPPVDVGLMQGSADLGMERESETVREELAKDYCEPVVKQTVHAFKAKAMTRDRTYASFDIDDMISTVNRCCIESIYMIANEVRGFYAESYKVDRIEQIESDLQKRITDAVNLAKKHGGKISRNTPGISAFTYPQIKALFTKDSVFSGLTLNTANEICNYLAKMIPVFMCAFIYDRFGNEVEMAHVKSDLKASLPKEEKVLLSDEQRQNLEKRMAAIAKEHGLADDPVIKLFMECLFDKKAGYEIFRSVFSLADRDYSTLNAAERKEKPSVDFTCYHDVKAFMDYVQCKNFTVKQVTEYAINNALVLYAMYIPYELRARVEERIAGVADKPVLDFVRTIIKKKCRETGEILKPDELTIDDMAEYLQRSTSKGNKSILNKAQKLNINY